MAQAQGINTQVAYKKQTTKGTAESGSGGQLIRRETFTAKLAKDTFSANEMNSHQQSTGDTYGVGRADATLAGVLSPGTYADFMASVLRANFAATTAITGLSLTIAGAGPTFTVARGTGSWLTDGIKIGDVVRITAGTFTGVARDINLLVTNVVALTLTVVVVNGKTLSAQGPVSSATLSVPGKKSKAPLTSHTNDYYTMEMWHSDISRSRLYVDMKPGKIDVGLPASGNATISIPFMGLDEVSGSSQVLTSPSAETTTPILTAVNGYLLLGGSRVVIATSASVSIDGTISFGEATIASKRIGDLVRGDIKVTGSLTALYEDETIGTYFDDETTLPIVFIVTDSAADASDFVTFSMSKAKILTKEGDDGKKQIVRTHNFSAEINGSGGPTAANDKTIITIQDSQAA